MIDLLSGLKTGQDILNAQRAEQAKSTLGVLRGGNSGYLVKGEVRGSCARSALLRFLGIEEQHNFSKQLMFAAGEQAEQIVIDRLLPAWDGQILAQKQVATKWATASGVAVTGSPDVVLADGDGVPQYGLEIKNVSSYWTMDSVGPWGKYKDGRPQPKPAHVAQASHYAWQLGVPYYIVYTNTMNWQLQTKGMTSLQGYPAELTRDDRGRAFRVEPFIMVFSLSFDEAGRSVITNTRTDEKIYTECTVQGIKDYYELVATCARKRELPPRMVNTDILGNGESWDAYDPRYNSISHLHDDYDSNKISFDQFVELARSEYNKPK